MARRRKSRSIRQREASRRLVDPGADASGRFDVSPFAARGHTIEVAPKELRSSPDSSFPKRIVTQRVIDRYRAHHHISEREWKAANAVWELWCEAESNARMTAGYDPVRVQTSSNIDGVVAKRLDAAVAFVHLMRVVPPRCQGVVRSVVIEDWTVGDWLNLRSHRRAHPGAYAFTRLRRGLSAIAGFLGY